MMRTILALACMALLGVSTLDFESPAPSQSALATTAVGKVVKVEATGTENNYTFAVTVSSPDTGCDRYMRLKPLLNGAFAPASRRDFEAEASVLLFDGNQAEPLAQIVYDWRNFVPRTALHRYADWWEVITPEGELLYRRVLLHSHVDEQPFTRTGGIVAISAQQPVIVRVHISTGEYSPIAQQGTVEAGFSEVALSADFAASLANVEPLPSDCAF